MKKAIATIIVGVVLAACGSDSTVGPSGSSSSSHATVGGSGSSSSYAGSNISGTTGGATTSTNGVPSGSVSTCGSRACTSTEECCLMIGSGSNTFNCVPKGTCTTTSPPPSDAGNPPPVDSGNPPPATCNGASDCGQGQTCCTNFGGAPSCRGGCNNGRQQVCMTVNECPNPANETCSPAGGGNNFMTCQQRVMPPVDAGADAGDAGRDSGLRDAGPG